MNLDPIIISLVALGVSIISILFSMHNSGVNRQIQLEQLRGNIITRLTIRGIEIGAIAQKLLSQNPEQIKIIKILTEVGEGILDVRKKIKSMFPAPFFTGWLTINLYKIKSDFEDSEYIFDNLKKAIDEADYKEAQTITEGLHERFFGKNKNT